MKIGRDYLASITQGNEHRSCLFEISRTLQGVGSAALQALISIDGGCLAKAMKQEPGYGQRILLVWGGRVPVLGAGNSAGDRTVIEVDPATAVRYYNVFTNMHPESRVLIPHQLPDDLAQAFDSARVYVPGPQDAAIGQYL